MNLWIKHPRNNKPDTMLSLGVYSFVAVLIKFLLNGASIEILDNSINFGTVDAAIIGALLVPTLGAYTARKYKDSPDQKEKKQDA